MAPNVQVVNYSKGSDFQSKVLDKVGTKLGTDIGKAILTKLGTATTIKVAGIDFPASKLSLGDKDTLSSQKPDILLLPVAKVAAKNITATDLANTKVALVNPLSGLSDTVISGLDGIISRDARPVTLDSTKDGLKNFNGIIQTSSGADTISLSASKGVTVDTGAGNDKLSFTGLVNKSSVAGGDGTDTFTFSQAFATTASSVTVVGGNQSDTLDLSTITGPVKVTMPATGNVAVVGGASTVKAVLAINTVETVKLGSGADTVAITGLGGVSSVSTGSGNDSISVAKAAISSANKGKIISVDGGSGTDTLDLTAFTKAQVSTSKSGTVTTVTIKDGPILKVTGVETIKSPSKAPVSEVHKVDVVGVHDLMKIFDDHGGV